MFPDISIFYFPLRSLSFLCAAQGRFLKIFRKIMVFPRKPPVFIHSFEYLSIDGTCGVEYTQTDVSRLRDRFPIEKEIIS